MSSQKDVVTFGFVLNLGGWKQLNQVSHEEIYLHQDPVRQIRQIGNIYVRKAVVKIATCHSGDCHL